MARTDSAYDSLSRVEDCPGFLRTTVAMLAMCALLAPAALARSFPVRVFARMPAPGYPASAVLDSDGYVYAGSFKPLEGGSDAPSKVFAFAPDGAVARSYTITGQTPGQPHGVQVAARDARGNLYLLDQAPARVMVLDPRTGAQRTYATIPTLSGGNAPEPDFAAWGPDGSLYVTDYTQYVIWRIPPGGGQAKVWLSNPAFNGVIVGPAGIELMADDRTLMFDAGGEVGEGADGVLYTVPIEPDGSPGALHEVWKSAPAEAPDGFAIARSGDVYVALVGPLANAVVELSPSGQELARVPANAVTNAMLTIPFDAPGSVLFDGDQILVGNQSAIDEDAAHMALLEVGVGEPGLPVYVPPPPAAAARLKLTVAPRRVRVDRRVRLRLTVSAGGRRVAGATVTLRRRSVRTGAAGRVTLRVRFTRPGRYRAVVRCPGYRSGHATVTARRTAR
jgi:sugar lactone lactonase YvrE